MGATVVGLGEVLLDQHLGKGTTTLGGAPANVACHAHQLLSPGGGRGVVASRVHTTDEAGQQVRRDLTTLGVPLEFLQEDPVHPTGIARVWSAPDGSDDYELLPAAWDHLAYPPALAALAATCDAVCFGLLAQRHPAARESVRRFLVDAPQAVRLLNVTLRRPHPPINVMDASCRLATMVQLNEEELRWVAAGLNLDANDPLADLRERYALDWAVLTLGSRGSEWVTATDRLTVPVVPTQVVGTVGAGDAHAATLLAGRLRGSSVAATARWAARVAAHVVAHTAAVPPLPDNLRQPPEAR